MPKNQVMLDWPGDVMAAGLLKNAMRELHREQALRCAYLQHDATNDTTFICKDSDDAVTVVACLLNGRDN